MIDCHPHRFTAGGIVIPTGLEAVERSARLTEANDMNNTWTTNLLWTAINLVAFALIFSFLAQ